MPERLISIHLLENWALKQNSCKYVSSLHIILILNYWFLQCFSIFCILWSTHTLPHPQLKDWKVSTKFPSVKSVLKKKYTILVLCYLRIDVFFLNINIEGFCWIKCSYETFWPAKTIIFWTVGLLLYNTSSFWVLYYSFHMVRFIQMYMKLRTIWLVAYSQFRVIFFFGHDSRA